MPDPDRCLRCQHKASEHGHLELCEVRGCHCLGYQNPEDTDWDETEDGPAPLNFDSEGDEA